MKSQMLHTPEGVRDIYAEECAKKLAVQDQIRKIFHLYGYQDIETPTFEFFDIFKKERGSVGSAEMFKFFDRDNNTLVLKPDITPSIARCVAKYFMDETLPLRLCYLEHTFTNNMSYQGRLKESTQTGVELIGDVSSDGDGEMIAMVIDALKATGLEEFQVEVGQVDFLHSLMEEAGMDEETQKLLRERIENKNYFGVEELVNSCGMDEELKKVFIKLPELFGPAGTISRVKTMTSNQRALKAVDRLERIEEILGYYGLSDYVSYDLGMLSRYNYYTGMIFKVYTYGTGDYIVTGGRYDKLLEQFGKEAPAVGFGIEVDRLLMALSRQKIRIPHQTVNTMVLYDTSARERAIRLAGYFRGKNLPVQLVRKPTAKTLEEYRAFAGRLSVRNILYLTGDGEKIMALSSVDDRVDELLFTDYIKA